MKKTYGGLSILLNIAVLCGMEQAIPKDVPHASQHICALWTNLGRFLPKHLEDSIPQQLVSSITLNAQGYGFDAASSRIVITKGDHPPEIWILKDATWHHEATLEEREGYWEVALFNDAGTRLVTFTRNNTAQVHVVDTAGKWVCETVLTGHTRYVYRAQFDKTGRKIVTASEDQTARVWALHEERGWQCEAVLEGHTGVVWSGVFDNPGKKIVTASKDSTARVWAFDGIKWRCEAILRGHPAGIDYAVFDITGTRIITTPARHSSGDWARVWVLDNTSWLSWLRGMGGWRCETVLQSDTQSTCSAVVDETGKKIFAFSHDRLYLWILDTIWKRSGVHNFGESSENLSIDKTGTKILTIENGHVKTCIFNGSRWLICYLGEDTSDRFDKALFNQQGTHIVTSSCVRGKPKIWDISLLDCLKQMNNEQIDLLECICTSMDDGNRGFMIQKESDMKIYHEFPEKLKNFFKQKHVVLTETTIDN